MATLIEQGNPSNRFSFPILETYEFIPIVQFKKPSKYVVKGEELVPSDEQVSLAKYIDDDKRNLNILQLTTSKKKIKLPFRVKQGGSASWDDDGFIEPQLSIKDANFKVISTTKILTKYNSDIEVELSLEGTESTSFYLDFYANDNEDLFKGGIKNIFCGRVKIVFKTPNAWEFSKEKINKIKLYAEKNNENYRGYGDQNRYHHCTDTHKHIIYKLLNTPNDLNFGKDQDHNEMRVTPNDFEKAGEATTKGVRNKTIAATYAEPSKIFTVVDIDNREVLTTAGLPGNTDKAIKSFKESPVQYMKNKCPDNGNYVFIGAYNDDYHSFTIIVTKENNNFSFVFVDQIVGVSPKTGIKLENKFLKSIEIWADTYPMKLELYQLRNRKK